jgi:hypothetical protein
MKKLLILLPLIVLLCATLLIGNNVLISVVFAQNEGSILFVEVWQLDGGSYFLRANFTEDGSVSVNGSQWFKFVVCHRFNSTLADSTQQAIDYTQVLMNITGIWTNEELNNTSCELDGDWYILKETGYLNQTLSAGETYECTILQKGYYSVDPDAVVEINLALAVSSKTFVNRLGHRRFSLH